MLLFCGLTFTEILAQENNFSISVKVTQGIEDAGYLVHIFNSDKTQRRFVDKITVNDKRTSFETHIDEPLVGDLTAIFPDSAICSACVRFPFVPGEQAQVKVKNGTFELSGSKFYQEWSDADELEENARKYYKQWETDSIILNYLKKHASEEGCVMRYWQYEILPRPVILGIIPESMKNGRFKRFFDGYQPQEDIPTFKASEAFGAIDSLDTIDRLEEADVDADFPSLPDISFSLDSSSLKNAPKQMKAMKKYMKSMEKYLKEMEKYAKEMKKIKHS
jgi:hypothetical protein